MYGLHKENIPMRPIDAATDSPTHELAKELTLIQSPLVGKTSSFVKNSTDFVKTNASGCKWLFCFDVVSLCTRVPVAEALTVVSHLLWNDSILSDRSAIPADTICSLVELQHIFSIFMYDQMLQLWILLCHPLLPINLHIEHFESVAWYHHSYNQSYGWECGQHLCHMATWQGCTLHLSWPSKWNLGVYQVYHVDRM